MYFSPFRKPEHRIQLRIGNPAFLVVHERSDHAGIHGAPPVVDQRHAAVLLIEGEAGLDAEPVGAVRLGYLRAQRVRPAVHGLGYPAGAVQQAQGYLRGLVARVPEARLAARDDVELVVG